MMCFVKVIFEGGDPMDLISESYHYIRGLLAQRKVDAVQAELLADMTPKVDWNDDQEKEEFATLMDNLSSQSSLSDDRTWGGAVGLDST